MKNLEEIIFMNNGLNSCLPVDIGRLKNVTVFNVSFNELVGPLPVSVCETGLVLVEQFNVAHNRLSGKILVSICQLPKLENFTYSYNFFTGEPPMCLRLPVSNERRNCLLGRPAQRSSKQCAVFLSRPPVDCGSFKCGRSVSHSPPCLYLELCLK
ncbi:unnamed protein product [Microthlaspi erraticum]|uniref:Leucine-rich repeat-containing N-terminal plant-type domain-containing protein n=1 Tax=Microthlaspi erraticum TaxID=1685480 RepID=A0A6D2K231_9BRAS|nr:unnamed protein product [Microthlaspi erraticum]